MDFNNLMTVQYSIKYDQNKLENVLKEIQSKINNFHKKVQQIDERFKHLEITDIATEKRVDNFEKFTIENLRLTVNQFTNLRLNLSNYFGEDSMKSKTENGVLQIIPKSNDFSNMFQSRLSAFNSEARKLSQKVNELQVQLVTKSSHQEEQASQVKQAISIHDDNINKIRNSMNFVSHQGLQEKIQRKIQQKLRDMRVYLEQRSSNQLNVINQQVSKLSISQRSFQQNITRRTSISQGLPLLTDRPLNHTDSIQGESLTLKKMGTIAPNLPKINQLEGIQDTSHTSTLGGNKKKQRNKKSTMEFSNLNKKIQQLEAKAAKAADSTKLQPNYQTPTITVREYQNDSSKQQKESMEHSINQLKKQIYQTLRSQVMQIEACLQNFEDFQQKIQIDVSLLKKQSSVVKEQLQRGGIKLCDIKHIVDNLRNVSYQNTQKSKQLAAKLCEHQQKIAQCNLEIKQLKRELSDQNSQNDQTQNRKLKQIQNLKRTQPQTYSLSNSTSGRNNSHQKTSFMIPQKDDNILLQRLNILTEKIVKIEDKLKNNNYSSSQTNLPKIDSASYIGHSKGGNTPSIDLLRKDVHKTNQELNKTNEKLLNLKKSLKELQTAHSLIPKKLQTLQIRINNVNQLQQDRLLELIKEIVNRVLTDPFNNHFTNGLKKQIHVKFLQIKHEYASIWKQIQNKVTDRAQASELQKIKEEIEIQHLQIKSMLNKKAQNQDLKKSSKYLQTKLKELYSYVKQQDDKSPSNRKYYMGKKA